jgi:hypothetical protein
MNSMSERDWRKNPPTNLEEAAQLAMQIAQSACDEFKRFGDPPHPERRGNTVVVVWPDGEVTNQIDVEYQQ